MDEVLLLIFMINASLFNKIILEGMTLRDDNWKRVNALKMKTLAILVSSASSHNVGPQSNVDGG